MTDPVAARPVEETFDGEAVGLEIEHGEDPESLKPWDPDRIRVNTKSFSLRNILDMIDEEGLELAPDFQRNKVWRIGQKSRLLESIMLQIPLPAFYFAEDADGQMRVVDGLQRLSTVHDFVRGTDRAFALTDLEYLQREAGKGFGELLPALQRRLHNTQIVVHVIAPTTPPEVTYNIFKRINTGGTPLNAQEIRHCMSGPRSRSFLRDCAAMPEFIEATGNSLLDHVRMGDRELVLRFCAFRLGGVEAFRNADSMDGFLLSATRRLDDADDVTDEQLAVLAEDFRRAMENATLVFGVHAFRKWARDQAARNPVNKPLFESWSVALADLDAGIPAQRVAAIRDQARGLMTDDTRYLEAITTSTGDPRKVDYRFLRANEATRPR